MKNLLNEIGQSLEEARKLAGVSLDEAANDLNIKVPVLDNMEHGNMGSFKDIFKLKDYLYDYAKYLGLNPEETINKFNEYLFEYTSKIPTKEIEKKIKEKNKLEDTQEVRIASPYTDDRSHLKSKSYIIIYILVALSVALAIFWAVKTITVDSKVATMVSWIEEDNNETTFTK